jgi:hypothetical protein
MGNEVYANNMEVSCKAANGKSICAFPDVCFTPPQTPATPPGVPIPYPNTGMASDTTDGSSSVKISGQEVMLKNKSYFKKSVGDEAGCAPKKGVISSSNTGKVYFVMWSMDVKAEGENVVRHLDLTTGNHACPTANEAIPWTYADRMAMAAGIAECDEAKEEVKKKCQDEGFDEPPCPKTDKLDAALDKREAINAKWRKKPKSQRSGKKKDPSWITAEAGVKSAYEDLAQSFKKKTKAGQCLQALQCFLTPEDPHNCCPGQTPHHLIPSSAIVEAGGRGASGGESVLEDFPDYKSKNAPCICAEGSSWHYASHRIAHNKYADRVASKGKKGSLAYKKGIKTRQVKNVDQITYGDALEGANDTAGALAPKACKKCIEAQVNKAHLGKKSASQADKKKPVRQTMHEEQYQSHSDEA